MENKKEDVRVKQSKQRLTDALLELLKTNKPEKITVTMLCRSARVTRGTFYNYFDSVESLVNFVQDSACDYFIKKIKELEIKDDPGPVFEEILMTMKMNRHRSSVLFGPNAVSDYCKKITRKLSAQYLDRWKKTYPEVDEKLLSVVHDYIVTGTLKIIAVWISSDSNIHPKALAQLITELRKSCLSLLDRGFTFSPPINQVV